MRFESSLVTNIQRINNKDAHRSNDSGAPRLGNDWMETRSGLVFMERIYEFIMTMATDEYEGSIPSLVTNSYKLVSSSNASDNASTKANK